MQFSFITFLGSRGSRLARLTAAARRLTDRLPAYTTDEPDIWA